jgi:REP element-mobilizing transposase RayT
MSLHSFSRCWLHLTWATLRREPMLPKPAALKVSDFLYDYSKSKGIYMEANYVNPDHTHAVIDLPTKHSIEEVLQLFKGASSHWINAQRMIRGKFNWGRGYGAFSVSHSNLDAVVRYVRNQEEHHRKKSFAEELEAFVRAYGLEWHDEEED